MPVLAVWVSWGLPLHQMLMHLSGTLQKFLIIQVKVVSLLSYTPWLKDILNDVYLASVAGYYKFDDQQAISGSLRYFSLGNIQFTDNLGNDLNTFRPREFGVDVGYSRKLSDKSGIGVGLKYIYSNLAQGPAAGNNYKAASAVAGDLAYYYQGHNDLGQGWAFGAVLSNLGSKISYTDNADQKDYIPANLGLVLLIQEYLTLPIH